MQPHLLLLRDLTYLAPDGRRSRGDIVIGEGGKIVRISPPRSESLDPLSPEVEVFEGGCSERTSTKTIIAIPGLVNAHFHAQSLAARGLTKNCASLSEWTTGESPLARRMTAIGELLDTCSGEDFETAAAFSFGELVREGITSTQDSGWGEQDPRHYARAAEAIGIRALVDGYGEDLAEEHSELVRFSAHLPEEEDLEEEGTLEEAKRRATRDGRILTTHCLETLERLGHAMRGFGKSTVALFDEHGLLRSPTLLFHLVHATDADIALLAQRNTSVAFCPDSNLSSGTGIAPVRRMLEAGLRVGVGTDWGSTDIWSTMRLAYALLQHPDPNLPVSRCRFDAECVWRMATSDGAAAIGLPHTGSIKEGLAADITFLEVDEIDDLSPCIDGDEDLASSTFAHNLLHAVSRRHVAHVMVAGRWVLRNRALVMTNEAQLRHRYAAFMKRALKQAPSK